MLSIYLVQLKTALAMQLQYRLATLISMSNRAIEPTVLLAIWVSVASARGEVGGYSPADLAAYFIVMMIINQLTYSATFHHFEWRIRSGEFSLELLRPLHPIHADISSNLADKCLTVFAMIPVVVLLSVMFQPRFESNPTMLLLTGAALIPAYFIRFFTDWAFAMSAFWTTRASALSEIYLVLELFFYGRFAPLELLPPWLEQISWLLPFRWVVWFPVELALNRLESHEIIVGFLLQMLWLIVTLVLLRIIFLSGLRKFTAVGG